LQNTGKDKAIKNCMEELANAAIAPVDAGSNLIVVKMFSYSVWVLNLTC
jgi:hypothetical protein